MTRITRFIERRIKTDGLTEITVPAGSVIVSVELRHCYIPVDGEHAVPGDFGWGHRPHVLVQEPIGKPETETEVLKVVGVKLHHHTDISDKYERAMFLAAFGQVLYFEVRDYPQDHVVGPVFGQNMVTR